MNIRGAFLRNGLLILVVTLCLGTVGVLVDMLVYKPYYVSEAVMTIKGDILPGDLIVLAKSDVTLAKTQEMVSWEIPEAKSLTLEQLRLQLIAEPVRNASAISLRAKGDTPKIAQQMANQFSVAVKTIAIEKGSTGTLEITTRANEPTIPVKHNSAWIFVLFAGIGFVLSFGTSVFIDARKNYTAEKNYHNKEREFREKADAMRDALEDKTKEADGYKTLVLDATQLINDYSRIADIAEREREIGTMLLETYAPELLPRIDEMSLPEIQAFLRNKTRSA